MDKFPKKRIMITGAGSGLGRAMALEFARLGWKICVSDINMERADETLDLVKKNGGEGFTALCDVTKPDQLDTLAETLVSQWGGVDIIVNNAGVAAAGYMEKIPLETWDWILDVNLKSVIYGCRTFIPILEKQGGGHIVNVASNAGIASLPEMSCYNVTKAGVIALSETLRAELKPKNIGVTVVAPTFFRTNLMDQFSSPDERQRLLAERMFQKSRTSAEKIARLIIRSVGRNRFYVVTPIDGRVVWFFKRHFPEAYMKAMAWSYRTGMFDRYTGLKGDAKGGAIQ